MGMAATEQEGRRGRLKVWEKYLAVALVALVVFFILLVVTPNRWLGLHSGTRPNESAAIGALRRINEMEVKYAKAHTKEGFACELSELRGMFPSKDDSMTMLDGQYSGYKFAFVGCTLTGDGVATQYQVVAEPVKMKETGQRAFCTEAGGGIFYDEDGNGEACLLGRKVLEVR